MSDTAGTDAAALTIKLMVAKWRASWLRSNSTRACECDAVDAALDAQRGGNWGEE